jgi:hypothetical protein
MWHLCLQSRRVPRSSETPVNMYHIIQRYIPKDNHFHSHRQENLKSHILILYCHCRLCVLVDFLLCFWPNCCGVSNELPRIFSACLKTKTDPVSKLTPWTESLQSQQLLNHSRSSYHFTKPQGSLPCSQEPSFGLVTHTNPVHTLQSCLRSSLILSSH